jgi:hypothetical protein
MWQAYKEKKGKIKLFDFLTIKIRSIKKGKKRSNHKCYKFYRKLKSLKD